MEDKRIRLEETELAYKKGFKWHNMSYTEIKQAYMRIEEVRGRLCCGVANFDMYFLMLKTMDDTLVKIEVTSRELVKQALEILQQKNENIEIGYKKEQLQPV